MKNNQDLSSGHGGKREGAGRKSGSLNKATQDVREIAQNYTDAAFKTLHTIMTDTEEPAAARISAAKEMLERGYGKSPQGVTVEPGDKELTLTLKAPWMEPE